MAVRVNIRPVLCGMIQENAWIVSVEGRDDCVVVNPGDEYEKLKAALGDRRVGAILLTHGTSTTSWRRARWPRSTALRSALRRRTWRC